MKSKRNLLKKSRLYVIIDKGALKDKRSIFDTANSIRDLDVGIVQFRDKASDKEAVLRYARVLRKILLNSKTIFIINDYLDIAKIVDCDGIHLGQDDISIHIARDILGKDKIIGVSCHNLKQAIAAQNKEADYISVGPIFPTPLKPESEAIGLELIARVRKIIKIPFFAIGGINESSISKVLSSGAKRVAVCRAVCGAGNISKTLKGLQRSLRKN